MTTNDDENDKIRNTDEADEEVGYGKPPKQSRFRKGQSGNPSGRPKGKKNLATVLEKTLCEKVVINENGVRRTITKMEAALKQLANKATLGDLAALRLLTALASSVGNAVAKDTDPNTEATSEADQQIMKRLFEKMTKSKEGGDGNIQ